jgi:hypothetical protein
VRSPDGDINRPTILSERSTGAESQIFEGDACEFGDGRASGMPTCWMNVRLVLFTWSLTVLSRDNSMVCQEAKSTIGLSMVEDSRCAEMKEAEVKMGSSASRRYILEGFIARLVEWLGDRRNQASSGGGGPFLSSLTITACSNH